MQKFAIRLHTRGLINGIVASLLLGILVLLGSRRLLYFDAALIPYLFATLFAVMGIVYRYTVWLDRPPTRRLWRRSMRDLRDRRFLVHLAGVFRVFFRQVVLQRFVSQRSYYRWVMHFSLAWGTIVAFAVTFPLVFGWLHFESAPGQPGMYQLYAFGFPQFVMDPAGLFAFFFFNALNFCSLAVILGTILAFTRRILHPDQTAGQTFAGDMLPLLILFAVAATGLFLTYSARFLGGANFRVLSTLHCFTVVVFLVYLPFGKFFHIFQRGAQMGAAVYIREKAEGKTARCVQCGDPYTSKIQHEDVTASLREIGFQYGGEAGAPAIQDLCPRCRRRLFMWRQNERLNGQFDLEHPKTSGKPGAE